MCVLLSLSSPRPICLTNLLRHSSVQARRQPWWTIMPRLAWYRARSSPLLGSKETQDKWLAEVSMNISKWILAAMLPQHFSPLLPSTLSLSSPRALLPVPQALIPRKPSFFGHFFGSSSSPGSLFYPSTSLPICFLPQPGLLCWPCSVHFLSLLWTLQMPLTKFSLISTIKPSLPPYLRLATSSFHSPTPLSYLLTLALLWGSKCPFPFK